jgi:hypothetical protein
MVVAGCRGNPCFPRNYDELSEAGTYDCDEIWVGTPPNEPPSERTTWEEADFKVDDLDGLFLSFNLPQIKVVDVANCGRIEVYSYHERAKAVDCSMAISADDIYFELTTTELRTLGVTAAQQITSVLPLVNTCSFGAPSEAAQINQNNAFSQIYIDISGKSFDLEKIKRTVVPADSFLFGDTNRPFGTYTPLDLAIFEWLVEIDFQGEVFFLEGQPIDFRAVVAGG